MTQSSPQTPRDPTSLDERALLNPAFVSGVLGRAAAGTHESTEAPLALALAYTIVPMALSPSICEVMPSRINRRLPNWLEENPVLRAELPLRAPWFSAVTAEGVRFGVRHELLVVSATGLLPGSALPSATSGVSSDVERALDAAYFFGRWLARVAPLPTVLALLRLSP